MDRSYEAYCLADPVFFESPTLVRGNDVDFALARGPAPKGWQRSELDDWLVYRPDEVRLSPQGWKVHVSACLEDAEEILAAVWAYCLPRRIPFKFIRSLQLLLFRNGKYAERGGSGKFVTIYPADETELEVVLRELGAALDGRRGPYILSDLRWGAGPLFVRYGGFAERYCVGANGELELAIADPDGVLVPDRRGTSFRLPPWVSLPQFLEPHLAARASTTIDEIPYRIDEAMHFSNGGGLYAGVDRRTGEQVVLKEGRPHAGLSLDGADAVARLLHERDTLKRLAGLDTVPPFRDHFILGEHHFLVLDLVDGTTLNALIAERYPLTGWKPDEEAAADYTAWVLDVCGRVERAVADVHERGVVIGDLHPSNMLVRPDGAIVLIDFEVAKDVSEARRPGLAAAGFAAPSRLAGFDIDRFALACMRLNFFLPLTALLALESQKAEEFADVISELFPVPAAFLADAVDVITGAGASPPGGANGGRRRTRPRLVPDPPGWRSARDSMAQAILSSATPERDDRLFPGDIEQFALGGLNLAYGAAGVLYALAACGAGRHPEHEAWLVHRATRPEPGTRLGFYDGLHGVAWALDRLERRSDALEVLDICLHELAGKWDRLGLDLYGGLAGMGLTLLHFAAATESRSLWDATWQVADIVAERLGTEDSVPEVSGGEHQYAGLVRGSSGPALMFIRLYEHAGDSELLDLAATALRQDLRRCVLRDDTTLEVNEGWRTMPYLADGSIGIGLALGEYLTHGQDERFTEAAAAIRRTAESPFFIEPGLFYGRAGIILYLSRTQSPGTADRDPVVAAQVRRMDWHALTYRGHLAFPGEQLLRLSMDLASGTAGVLLALGAALHDAPVHLPFLESLPVLPTIPADRLPSAERR